MRRLLAASWLAICLTVSLSAGPGGTLRVEPEITGMLRTNCYLLYDAGSREAALVDPGDAVDRLLGVIATERLRLHYILVTHAHADHVAGIPAVRAAHPGARLVMSGEEFADGPAVYARWETSFPASDVVRIKSSPEALRLFGFDYRSLGRLGVTVREGQALKLGALRVVVISTPGHSRGGVCYRVGDTLFSGDTMFRGRIGSTNLPGSARDALVVSVKRLLAMLPKATVVLPGHGERTDIGAEKVSQAGLR